MNNATGSESGDSNVRTPEQPRSTARDALAALRWICIKYALVLGIVFVAIEAALLSGFVSAWPTWAATAVLYVGRFALGLAMTFAIGALALWHQTWTASR